MVEGPTEERFVRSLLAPHLEPFGIVATPILVRTRIASAAGRPRGGDWRKWQRDIERLLENPSSDLRVTTFFDLYGLPADFPELAQHETIPDTRRRAELLENAMAKVFLDLRFLPYLQRHEFEALVLASLEHLEPLLNVPPDHKGLRKLLVKVGHLPPEDVDDGPGNSPSKRLARFIPSYAPPVGRRSGSHGKSFLGPAATQSLGLPGLREKCPRFDAWISKLEALTDRMPR